MALSREDATRIVRFCLAGVGWGTAVHEDDACVVKIVRSDDSESDVRRFEGDSFEEALRHAGRAGTLNALSVEKQINFLSRSLPNRVVEPIIETPAPRIVLASSGASALFPGLTEAISAFLNEAQRERGISALYLSSGGRLFGARLRAQWRATDDRLGELVMARDRYRDVMPPVPAQCMSRADAHAQKLTEHRAVIQSLGISAGEAIAGYSEMNGEYLSVIDTLASRSVETPTRATALAWMALLHAKEKTGIERAQLASAFTWDRYSDGQHAAVSALISASRTYLHLFSAAAPVEVSDLLHKGLTSDLACSTVEKMEQVALMNRDGGFGIDPEDWFLAASRKMDMFADVESAIRSSLRH